MDQKGRFAVAMLVRRNILCGWCFDRFLWVSRLVRLSAEGFSLAAVGI